MVPLAWAFRCMGDEVLVATAVEAFGGTVTQAGLPVSVVSRAIGPEEYPRVSAAGLPGDPLEAGLAASGRGWGALAARAVKDMGELVDSYLPDLVISEPGEFAGRIAAAERGLPWVEHSWALPFPPGYTAAAGSSLSTELSRLGLADLPAPVATVHPSPPSLWPDAEADAIAMRYVPYNGQAVFSDRNFVKSASPRVLITFGSLQLKYGDGQVSTLVTELVERLTGIGCELVLGMDGALVPGLRPLPAGVLHVGWTPLNLVLADCDLVIHHGGSGTSMTAAAFGLPQLTLPQATDQFITSGRLAAHGTAIRLEPERCSSAQCLDAAVRLLDDPSYRTGARALARELADLPSPAAVAEGLRRRVAI
ncbi:nucleotide disphospho-sugar-binding domain-containing protein [Streptosporangium sp. NPDC001559]|uniref:nucleotide disphospho-sugar-binding domain-containing protein n=1 Tax=Streptosporangium sp. NPDC001559 TaxID=3366187 RepID=UPI0036E84251